jgi:ssDNA-binding Zn-finger/Zn-ribbon topoisomerase 1
MLNFINLALKCPQCGKLLMDEEKLIDNVPSIKLFIRIGAAEGYIWLSAIYGSYNIDSTIEIKDQDIALFKCTHCLTELTSAEKCGECGAPMVDFHLYEGGKVSICSRAGCRKHSIEFEDLATAMNHFYNEFEVQKHTPYEAAKVMQTKTKSKTAEKEIIETGTFLNSYCPHCRMNLISEGMIIFKIEKDGGDSGILYLSPYLNVFKHATTIQVPEKIPVKDIKCIYCDKSMVVPDEACPVCGSAIAKIHVSAMKKLADFKFCTRKGCKWHGISDEDLGYIMLEDSQEW